MDKQYISFPGLKTEGSFSNLMILLAAVFLFASCSPIKNSYYFKTLKKDTTITGLVNKDMESKIIKGDNLSINISSLAKDEDVIFNTSIVSAGVVTGGVIVDKDGTVYIHKVGRIQAEGLTRKEFAAVLQKQLLPYVKDPIVTVQYLNHKVTIIGEVTHPQVLSMAEEQISLIDLLVLSGDLTERGKRTDVMIIRENGNEKKVKHVNLEDHSIFSSPWYYLQPNDIVVVIPDFEKSERDARRARFQTNFSILLSTVSLVLIIADRVFR